MRPVIAGILDKFKKGSLTGDTAKVTFFSIIGKGVGFLIPFFVAAWFGVSPKTDALFFAYEIILFLSVIAGPALENSVVPFIAEIRSKGENVGLFLGRLLLIIVPVLIILTLGGLIAAKPLLAVVTKFDVEGQSMIFRLLIEMAPLGVLLIVTSILNGSMNAFKSFTLPALSPAFRAVVTLAVILCFKDTWGVYAIARGYVLGEAFRVAVLLWMIRHQKLFHWHIDFLHDTGIKNFMLIVGHQAAGMVAVGLNPLIDKTMASWLGHEKVSTLFYADRLYVIPVTFLTSGLVVTILSHWSTRYYEFGVAGLEKNIRKSLKIIGGLTLVITLLVALCSGPIVNFAYNRGVLNVAILPEIKYLFLCYLAGVVPYILARVLVRALLILKESKCIMQVGLLKNGLNIILNLIMMRWWGIYGIALSTSLIAVFEFLIFRLFIKRVLIEKRQI